MTSYNKELTLAVNLVKKAAEITEWFRNKGFKSFLKSDQSPVTVADFASQIYIASELKNHFSDDEIIAEEENMNYIGNRAEDSINQCLNELNINGLENAKDYIKYRGKSSERQWTIDPIDGTIGFQKGLLYAVGVGFMENSIPRVCAIAVPNYAGKPLTIFSAEQGQGAQMSYNNSDIIPIKVSQKEKLEEIRLCHSLHYDQPWVLQFARKIGITNFVQIDSMAKFAMVADESADLYIKPLDMEHSFTWDFLPGDLIVREAGGTVTDLNGTPIRFKDNKCIFTKPGIISSNALLHKKILSLIKENFSNFFS
jgi:3'-phosphoadenosine 5'-phosphosulfate (PAPS) 3'-phosphatase